MSDGFSCLTVKCGPAFFVCPDGPDIGGFQLTGKQEKRQIPRRISGVFVLIVE
jgi:hypothetical protein